MARMSLDTAIRLSAEVRGGANITKVQRSLQDLAKGSQTTAREMGTLRSATFQYARANDSTIAGIRNSITAFRGLQEQAKIGSREFTRYGTEIQRLEGKLRGLDGTAQKAGASLGRNLAAGLAAAGIGRMLQGITAQAGKFDAELRKAAAIEGGAGSFGVLRKEIEAVAAAAAGTPTEVAALATALSRAGFSAKETTEALRGIVLGAEATSVTFEEMGSIAADNLRAFGLQTNETARVVDVLTQTAGKSNQTVLDLGESMKYAAPIAKNLGVPLEDLAAVMGLLANNGIRGSDAGTALRTGLTRLQIAAGGADSEIADLTRGNVQLTKAMATLGSEILGTDGKLRPLDQVLNGLRKSLSGLSATDQAILTKALFGTEAGSKFQALLNSSEGQIRQMFAAIRDSGGVAEETQKKMQGFEYSVKVLGGNVEYLTNQIGGMIGMALKPLIDGLNTAIGAAQNLPGPIKAIGAAAAAAAVTTLGLVVAVAALKSGLALLGVGSVVTAVQGLTVAAVGAKISMMALNAVLLINPWFALAAGIGAATFALAGYQTQSQRTGASARSGGAVDMASARNQLSSMGQEISLLELQREKAKPGRDRGGIDQQLNRLRSLQKQLSNDVAAGARAEPVAAPVLPPPPGGAGDGGAGAAAAVDGGAGGGGAKAKPESIGAQVAKALAQALDLTPAQAAGVVGNLMRESGLNPRVNEGGAVGAPRGVGSYGLAQWTGSRQKDLIRFAGGAAGAGDMQTQLRFMVSELMGPESKALASLRKTTTPEDAAVVFDRDYERSGIKALPERKANARRVYSEISGSGPGAGLDDFAGQLKTQAQAAETMREQQQSAKDLLATEGNRLQLLQIADPLQKQVAESMVKQLTIMEEYGKRLVQSKSEEETKTLQQAQQNALKANSLELDRELKALGEDAMKPLQDAVQEYGNRLAYEREYGGLLKTGINPELAKQYIEIDRIAEASRASLELQIENTEEMLAQTAADSELRKGLEERIRRQRELLGLVPEKAAEAKDNAKETNAAQDRREKDQAAAEQLKDLYKGINSTIEEGIIGSMQAGIESLIDGTKRLDESLKEILAGVIKDISNQLIRFAVTTGLNAVLGGIGGGGGGGDGGGPSTPVKGPGEVFSSPDFLKYSSFAGGGYTGSSPRAGGIDGQGGFPAILHPQETVIDHARMMPVPYQASPAAAAASELTVPYQSSGQALSVPFLKAGGDASGDGMAASIDVKFETVRIGNMDVVTREEAQRIGQESAQRGAELASKRYRNNPSARRRDGIR